MLEAASQAPPPPGERERKIEQCEAILKAYRRAGGSRVPAMGGGAQERHEGKEESVKEGEEILEEIGLEKPQIPRVTFEDVAGLEDVKREILAKLIYPPMRFRELSREYNVQFGGWHAPLRATRHGKDVHRKGHC